MNNDQVTTIEQLKEAVRTFVDERDWNQFHTPKNLSMNVAIEAAELMELFLWISSEKSHEEVGKRRENVERECADILIALLAFANATNIDLTAVFNRKLQETKDKYPADLVFGRNDKYTAYLKQKDQ